MMEHLTHFNWLFYKKLNRNSLSTQSIEIEFSEIRISIFNIDILISEYIGIAEYIQMNSETLVYKNIKNEWWKFH